MSREELITLVRDQAAQLADQAIELERLRAELEQIKRLISRNSGNSSMPPSTDDLPGRAGRRKRASDDQPGGTKRKRGKQPGVPGTHLPWLDEAGVRVVDRRPQGSCGCGADLADAADEGVERACQVTDVPTVTASTVEYRMHQVRCGCGRAHVAPAPDGAGVANTRVYGANLRALVVYLLIVQHVPVHRCVRLIADLAGAGVSAGFVHKMLAAAAAAVAEVVKSIKTLITLAVVVHFDETTGRARPASPSTCGPPAPTCIACSPSGGAAGNSSGPSGSGRRSPGWPCTTGTPSTTRSTASPTVCDINSAARIYFVILTMRPKPTPTRSGRPSVHGRCVGSSTPRTSPAPPGRRRSTQPCVRN